MEISVAICGHVDAGKCSTTGLLLYELGGLTERELEQLRAAGPVRANLRTVLHERGEESSRGFIIRSKTRRIDTEHRKCTLITVPGHRDFVKNVFAGAQQADAAILVVPADETFPSAIAGGFDGPGQSRHHAQILSAMGVKQLCVVVNKMDSAAARFSQERFEEISQEVRKMLLRSGWPRAAVDTQIPIVPISAWTGANFMAKSEDMPWWSGQELTSHKGDTVHVDTLYDVLNSFFEPPERLVDLPLRMVVSEAFKVELGHVVVGRLEHGALKVGDAVSFRPGAVGGEVQEITRFREPLVTASAGQIVAARMHLADGDRPRYGDVMVGAADCTLQAVQNFTAEVLVLDWPGEIRVGYCPLVFARGGKVPCRLSQLTRRTARDGTEEEHPEALQARDVAECTFVPRMPFLCEAFRSCESFGRLIFMDGNQMIAVGKVLRCETHEDKDKGGKKK